MCCSKIFSGQPIKVEIGELFVRIFLLLSTGCRDFFVYMCAKHENPHFLFILFLIAVAVTFSHPLIIKQ